MFGKRISEEQLADLVDAAVCKRIAALPRVDGYKDVAGLKANLAALYKHLGIERVEVRTATTTDNLLTGLRDVVNEFREQMRKVPKAKE
jgi:hypothetical protein